MDKGEITQENEVKREGERQINVEMKNRLQQTVMLRVDWTLERRVTQSEESATARLEGEENSRPIFGDGEPGLYHQVKLQEEKQNKK
jgi:hypothetical protein